MDRRPDRATSDAGRTRNGGPDRGPADGPGPMLTDPFRAPPVSGSPARPSPARLSPVGPSPVGPSPVEEVLVASGSRGPGGGPGGGPCIGPADCAEPEEELAELAEVELAEPARAISCWMSRLWLLPPPTPFVCMTISDRGAGPGRGGRRLAACKKRAFRRLKTAL